ncbi:MAG: hypothetical protein HYR56_03455 [Acidobacteria bacterium]|nr:hypothetical protein [Acidobacteriota bacterium]MBI3422285.1 hypothetical protein [Acidobacteriota bacterium]
MLNNNTLQQNNPATTPAWRKPVRNLGLALILSLATLGSATAVLGQEPDDKPLAIPARLGLKSGTLTPMPGRNIYQANPIVNETAGTQQVAGTRSTSGVSDMVGTLSVQNFQGTQANLSNTHASADGFRNYFNTWYTANFARRDSAVSVWLYNDIAGGDNYDLWTSGGTDLGIDAVRAAWHSGHGGMWSTNVFFAPMGANWGGRGWNAFSNQMFLGGNNYSYGDERLRYMFWDTCNSVMVSGGNDPYSTWGTRSRGVRMVFGYETTSVDSGDYGKYFWEEWNKGKTLSQAFLDASWRINTGQSPSVVAFGSDATDATNRLNNERYLYAGSVGNNWGQWRWYYARSAARAELSSPVNAANLFRQGQTPMRIYSVAAKSNTADEFVETARIFGIKVNGESQIQNRPQGLRAIETPGATLVMEANGNFELALKATATPNNDQQIVLGDDELIRQARELAGQLSLLKGQELTVGLIRDLNESGGGNAATLAARVVEKTVIFDQMIDGLPFIDPQAGHLEITFDARTGQARSVRSTLQQMDTAKLADAAPTQQLSVEDARYEALSKAQLQAKAGQLEIVAGSEATGWHLLDGKIVPVFRAEVKDPNQQFGRPQLVVVPLIK